MNYREWRTLADRVIELDEVQLHSIVLHFLNVTDVETATAAIDQGLKLIEDRPAVSETDGGNR